jgi:hypothetical protein
MRPRAFLLVLTAILLVLPATGIVNAEEAAAPETTEQLACVAQTPADAAEEISIQTEVYTNRCGDCSVSRCRGLTRGTSCGFGLWCIPTDTMFCPGTDDWDCQCAKYYN